tara:strand:- start:2252 stop:2668 length:417 start_codon:yes stop_codon:yes gene_type:complete
MVKNSLIYKYILFSFIATFANIFTQRIIFSFNKSNSNFIIAILCGTFVGLILKFYFDKKWIFYDKVSSIKAEGLKFGRYTSMGIISTLVFWITETVFWLIWETAKMREVGAIIGLSFGYIIKYNLDKRFVFAKKPQSS